MSPDRLAPGARIDARFLLKRRLGVGGYGAVWLAEDEGAPSVAREVALKLLHPRLHAAGGIVRERFEREAAVLARLDHPSLVKPFAYRVDGEHAYIAMEYVAGLPLNRVLKACAKRDEPLEAKEAARIFDELAAAMHYVHGEGVVHRDLKPGNVMLVRRGGRAFVKVLDLGIARVLDTGGRDATTVGRMLGSMFYCAPEQLRGEPVDARCDVFALGVILFELLTNHRAFVRDGARCAPAHRPPFRRPENAAPAVIERISRGPRPRPSDLREGLPLRLDEVVARALHPQPEARYQTAGELAEAAAPLLAQLDAGGGTTLFALPDRLEPTDDELVRASETDAEPASAAPPTTSSSPERPLAPPPPRTRLNPWLALGAGLLAGAALMVVVMSRSTPDTVTFERPSVGVRTAPVSAPPRVVPRPAPPPPASPAPQAPAAAPPPRTAARRATPLPASAPSALDRLVRRARARPGDLSRVAALEDAVRAAIQGLPAGPERTRLERQVATSAMDGDVEGLAACARRVEAAARSSSAP